MLIETIVSGGQTGADRAALDWALEHGVAHEGWCPAGRRAEDGPISGHYRLRETEEEGYLSRTECNVRDSDGTVILTLKAELSGGSLATARFAKSMSKPWVHISRADQPDPGGTLRRFVREHGVRVLNVAGPRASGEPGVGHFVVEVLSAAFEEDAGRSEMPTKSGGEPGVLERGSGGGEGG